MQAVETLSPEPVGEKFSRVATCGTRGSKPRELSIEANGYDGHDGLDGHTVHSRHARGRGKIQALLGPQHIHSQEQPRIASLAQPY